MRRTMNASAAWGPATSKRCVLSVASRSDNGEICDVCLRDWTEREEEQEARDRQTDAAMLQGGLAQDSEADNG